MHFVLSCYVCANALIVLSAKVSVDPARFFKVKVSGDYIALRLMRLTVQFVPSEHRDCLFYGVC